MTGLIYVAIIAVWAVVLVPAWLRRHDHLDPERSVDRFTRSMQILARRPSLLGIPLPAPETEEGRETEDVSPETFRVSRAARSGGTAAAGQMAARVRSRAATTPAAARRRVVLAALGGALGIVGALVTVGVLLPIALVIPVILIVAFLAAARRQVRAARLRRAAPERRTMTAPAQSAAPAEGHPVERAAGTTTWEARHAPLPSYVTAPAASEFPRVIDTATPGAWTAAAMLERAQQEKVRAERMAAAKAEAIARAKAEQAAAEARNRDEEYLAQQSAQWHQPATSTPVYRRRAVNE